MNVNRLLAHARARQLGTEERCLTQKVRVWVMAMMAPQILLRLLQLSVDAFDAFFSTGAMRCAFFFFFF